MTGKKKKKPLPAINVRVQPELKAALKAYCQANGLKMSWAIKQAIKTYIKA